MRLGKHFDAEIHACRAEELAEELQDKESFAQAIFLRGRIVLDLQELSTAQPLLEQAYGLMEGDPKQRVKVLTYLAHCLMRQKKLKAAHALYELVLPETNLIPDAPDQSFLMALQGLGDTLQTQKLNMWALMVYDEILWIQNEMLDDQHPNQANVYQAIGKTYQAMERHEDALGSFANAMAIRTIVFGEYHLESFRLRLDTQHTLLLAKRYQDVVECSERWAPAFKLHLGMGHRYTRLYLNNSAASFEKLGNWEKVREILYSLFTYFRNVEPSESPNNIVYQNDLGRALYALGNLKEADEHVAAALEKKQTIYGKTHVSTKRTERLLQLIRKKQKGRKAL